MEKVNIPTEKVQEPYEGARHSQEDNTMAGDDCSGKHLDNSCSYKDILSQPAPKLSHREKLLWLQKRRGTGLWVSCDKCLKWRYMPHILDKHELPKQWFCELNPDRRVANCSVAEEPLNPRDEEDLIHSEYSAGSVVWARLQGWPWWPAMVDDCVDIEQFYWLDGFSDIPTSYNVVFFDSNEVTRAWIPRGQLKPYNAYKNVFVNASKKYKKRLQVAIKQADDADMLPVANRLSKYSFIARYKNPIDEPKKLDKELKKRFKNKIQRQFNVHFFDLESDSDSDTQLGQERANSKRRKIETKNVILLGGQVEKADERTEDTNVLHTEEEKIANTEITVDFFMQPLAASNVPNIESSLPVDTLNYDNDSSKTYVPETEAVPHSTYLSDINESECEDTRVTTPCSGDFDF